MKRRRFLAATGLTLVGLQTGCLGGCSGEPAAPGHTAVDSPQALPALEALARSLRGIDYLGPRCAALPELQTHDDLIERLLARLRADQGTLASALEQAIRTDFRNDEVLDIEDWRLSVTECMLAALAADQQGLALPEPYTASHTAGHPDCKISHWGPRSTRAGQTFNEQPDGSAAFWVRTDCAPQSAQLHLASIPLRTTVRETVITGNVPHFATLKSGRHPLVLFNPEDGTSVHIGDFVVE